MRLSKILKTTIGAIGLFLAHAADAAVILPPAEYDHPFAGRLIVETIPFFDVQSACGRVEGFYGSGRVDACSRLFADNLNPGNMACHIIYPRAVDEDTMVALIRHETGHCNGWAYDHPNGRF